MHDKSEDITELAKALCKVQSEALFALTDKENPFFKSKYADLSSCWSAAREPLTKNGLSVAQLIESTEDGTPIIVTMLMHESGQWIKSSLAIKPDKAGPQALGSAITYGRRYAFCAIVGICPEDDDAENAEERKKQKQPKSQPTPTQELKPMSDPQRKKLFAMCKEATFSTEHIAEFNDYLKGLDEVEMAGDKISSKGTSYIFDNFDKLKSDFIEKKVAEDDIPY